MLSKFTPKIATYWLCRGIELVQWKTLVWFAAKLPDSWQMLFKWWDRCTKRGSESLFRSITAYSEWNMYVDDKVNVIIWMICRLSSIEIISYETFEKLPWKVCVMSGIEFIMTSYHSFSLVMKGDNPWHSAMPSSDQDVPIMTYDSKRDAYTELYYTLWICMYHKAKWKLRPL